MSELEKLLAFCTENGRVCPAPQKWNELWQMLPEKTQHGAGWQPPLPLILAAWWEASDDAKRDRLKDHLQWADSHGALDPIVRFLRSLPEGEWHHRGE
jgi:hypothetical protein